MAGQTDIIFARASGIGRAAVAVIRVSGSRAADILQILAGTVPPPRRAALRDLRNNSGVIIDQALVIFMPGPKSFTGEDCVELQLHGGRAVVAAVSGALIAAGCRPAEAGEFTRRAFLNGRMDLLEAEGIADLISAETEAQRRQAMRQVSGGQSAMLALWRERLRLSLAAQEALIDFPDEDLGAGVEAALCGDLAQLRDEMAGVITATRDAIRVREGIVVAVLGPPNVGKSSLVNALVDRDVAITSAQPGTTRDALEVAIIVAGVPVILIDTAGLRETEDPVEAEGVRRARSRAAQADILLSVREVGGDQAELAEGASVLRVANKIDLGGSVAPGEIGVSARSGAGLDALKAALQEKIESLTGLAAGPSLTQMRHQAALTEAVQALDRAIDAELSELRGEDLRLALNEIGRISGVVDVEQVLDAVFSRFCIGK